jgi:argininosuccinate lyase
MSKKLWAGRFEKQTHPDVDHYTASILVDRKLVFDDILGSLAHTLMLEHCGIINSAESNQLQEGLRQIAQRVAENNVTFRIEDEDVHMNIERLLKEAIGDVAGKLHTARSRNDQVALDMHLYLRKHTLMIIDLLIQLQRTLLHMAKQHDSVILPGYTHLQRAQPIYLAQHWLAYVSMIQRDVERLQESWKRVNQSPLGACALTGTTFNIDRHYVASTLGFDGIYLNTLDAVSDRDFVIEFLSASSLIMMHISRLSEELILWSSQEFNFITFDDAFCTGSSIMPQKKNPDVVELGRGKTGRVYGALFAMLTLLKGLPLAYNKDLQEDKEPLFDVIHTLEKTLALYHPLLSSMKINTEVMRQAADEGYLNATALAEYLVRRGMTFRNAHESVGKMVAFSMNKNCRLEDLSLTEMKDFSACISEDVYHILSTQAAISACDMAGHTTGSLLKTELMLRNEAVSVSQTWLLEKNNLLENVYSRFAIPLRTEE